MPLEYHCPTCNETFQEADAAAMMKRAAAHNHEHHGGPESITPEIEAAINASVHEV